MKGQAAMEFILVAAFIALIIVPATYLFYSYAQDSTKDIKESQIATFGRNTVNFAELMYYQGPPSRITIEHTLPEGVTDIDVLHDWSVDPNVNELFIRTNFEGEISEFAFPTAINIIGVFDDVSRSEGLKKVRLQTGEAPDGTRFVLLLTGGLCAPSFDYDVHPPGNPDGELTESDIQNCQTCIQTGGTPAFCQDLQCDYDGDCQETETDLALTQQLYDAINPES